MSLGFSILKKLKPKTTNSYGGRRRMKLKILGSGGGEGFPSSFCNCVRCENARKKAEKVYVLCRRY